MPEQPGDYSMSAVYSFSVGLAPILTKIIFRILRRRNTIDKKIPAENARGF
jgi:hypothetical protein